MIIFGPFSKFHLTIPILVVWLDVSLLSFDVRLCPASGPVLTWDVVSEVLWLGTVCLVELLTVPPTALLSVAGCDGVVVVTVVVVDISVVVVETSVDVVDPFVDVSRSALVIVNGILMLSPSLQHQTTLILIWLITCET